MVNFPGNLMIDAVIFDFDGVIVDTEPIHYQAFQKVLEPLGLGFSWQQYVNTYMGFDDRDAFNEAFNSRKKSIDPTALHNLINIKAHVFLDIIREGVTAYPGVVNLIKKLHNEGVPLAICSGALYSDVQPIISMLNITECFDIIVTADDVSKSKPDPECYCLAYNKLYHHQSDKVLSKARTFAIEDTPAGIEAAKEAGLQVIAVTNSYTRQHLFKAHLIVDSLEELGHENIC